MGKILLDSSIIIDYLRQTNKKQAFLSKLGQGQQKLYTSIIVHTECYAGKSIWEKKEAREALKVIFSGIQILPLDESISQKAGEISARYNIEIVDAIIAATALSSGMPLATLNLKDFKRVAGLKIFKS